MPQITIQNIRNKTVSFQECAKTVLKIFQENQVGWMHACGGNGRCTTCKMTILSGTGNLSPLSRQEVKMQQASRLEPNERLACQSIPTGDLVVRVPDQNKLPHITYTD